MEVKSKNDYYILQDADSKGILQLRVFLWRVDVAKAIIAEFKAKNKSFNAIEKCVRTYRTIYRGELGKTPQRILFRSQEYRKIQRLIETNWSKK